MKRRIGVAAIIVGSIALLMVVAPKLVRLPIGKVAATFFGSRQGERDAEAVPAPEACTLPSMADRPAARAGAPNVILIAVDTLRADRLGFDGYLPATSPALDRLALESVVFDRAISPAPWTMPAFAGVFTGVHPAALGVEDEPIALPPQAVTIAEELVARGYAAAGVISHTFVGADYGFDRSFDFWDQEAARGHAYVSSGRVTDLARMCVDALDETGRPFLLFAHYFDPHYDWVAHPQYTPEERPASWIRSAGNNIGFLRWMAEQDLLREADLRALEANYDSEIAFTDQAVGALLDHLRDRGVYDDALVIFLADHGESFARRPDRWLGHTRLLYDELIRVPLLVKLPGQARTGRVDRLVSTTDVKATVLSAVDPAAASPRSLLQQVDAGDAGEASPGPVFSQTGRGNTLNAILLGDWKLIVNPSSRAVELYDVRNDPGELDDVSDAQPERVAELRRSLDAWLFEVADAREAFGEGVTPELSEEELERLRALGYTF